MLSGKLMMDLHSENLIKPFFNAWVSDKMMQQHSVHQTHCSQVLTMMIFFFILSWCLICDECYLRLDGCSHSSRFPSHLEMRHCFAVSHNILVDLIFL